MKGRSLPYNGVERFNNYIYYMQCPLIRCKNSERQNRLHLMRGQGIVCILGSLAEFRLNNIFRYEILVFDMKYILSILLSTRQCLADTVRFGARASLVQELSRFKIKAQNRLVAFFLVHQILFFKLRSDS